MKKFKNPIHRKEFTNKFGEKMTMVMSANCSVWIHHEDCNKDFEKVGEGFNYILDRDEMNAITEFMAECDVLVKNKIKDLEN